MKVEYETQAWITGNTLDPKAVIEGRNNEQIAFSSNIDVTSLGWTKLGPAKIQVEMPSMDGLIGYKIDSLAAERVKIMADTQMKIDKIEEQISILLALPLLPA